MSEEKKEQENKEVKADANVAEAPTPEKAKKVKEEPKKKHKLTPEQERAQSAMVLQVSLFPDGQLEVKSVQNINSRAMAEYLVSRAKDDYFKADVANLAAVRLIDLIRQSNQNKKKTDSLWTPGAEQK